jgi:hypothetical protein
MLSDADARSAPRPTSTADNVTGPPAGTRPLALGTIVRTMGAATTTEGDATGEAEGLLAIPGDGTGRGLNRSASLAVSVGGTPGGVGAASLPGTAPRSGRSLAGAQLASASAANRASNTSGARRLKAFTTVVQPWSLPSTDVQIRGRVDSIGLSLRIKAQNLKNKCDTADDGVCR